MKFEDYEPYGAKLYKHQRETVLFILKHKRCFIFDDIGTGKTMAVLAAVDFLILHKKIKRVLVVCPLSVMRATWVDHILKHFPGRSFTVLHGNKKKRLKNLEENKEIYIINTDGIKVMEDALLKKEFDIVVIDESTSFSHHTASRTKCMWRLTKKIKSVIPMTGAPIPNNTLQSYAQAKLVNFNDPKYYTAFRDKLKVKFDMYTYIDRPTAVGDAYNVLRPSIRHKIEDCVDLPPISYQTIAIKLSPKIEKIYMEMEQDYLVFLEDNDEAIVAANAAVKYTKLLQISCGLLIDNNGKPVGLDHKNRMIELKRILGQTSKVIIFASFTHSVNSLVKEIPNAIKIDGSIKERDRHSIIRDFQEGDLQVLVCQPAAISHGVTLTASNTIIWWSPCYSNEHFIQCNGRIRRSGQTRPQLVINFIATKAEARIYQALRRKENVSQAMLNFNAADDDDNNDNI